MQDVSIVCMHNVIIKMATNDGAGGSGGSSGGGIHVQRERMNVINFIE